MSYRKIEKLGEGSYGVVYKAVNTKTGEYVAIKKIKSQNPDEGVCPTSLREISILKAIHHPAIVNLLQAQISNEKIVLVFEYVDRDLKAYLDKVEKPPDETIIAKLMYQLFAGLAHCHKYRILHRDLKPANLLVADDFTLKIADFGLGREFTCVAQTCTAEVCTLLYRPPEILLGNSHYTAAVDVWSCGCVFAECYLKEEPLFIAKTQIGTLFEIFQRLGTPSNDVWKGVENFEHFNHRFPKWKAKKDWTDRIPNISLLAQDLLNKCFIYRPLQRPSCAEIMKHSFFDEIRKELTNY